MNTAIVCRRQEIANWVTPQTSTKDMVEAIEQLDYKERQDQIRIGASPIEVWTRACEEGYEAYKLLQQFVDNHAKLGQPLNAVDADAVHWISVSGARLMKHYSDLQEKAFNAFFSGRVN